MLDAVGDVVSEAGWVVDHVADLEADFRAFYGVEDMLALPGPEWLRLAVRTVAFPGVMRARADALRAAEEVEDAYIAGYLARQDPEPAVSAPADEVVVIDATREAVAARPEMAGLIDWGAR